MPLTPTGFSILSDHHRANDTIPTFEWDPPGGMGPQTIVDYYIISISPSPLSHPGTNIVHSSPWNVTLAYNTLYNLSITAVNCAGESGVFVLTGLEFGKVLVQFYC